MAPTKVLSPSKLAHVALQTTQLPAMRDFYTTALGATIVHEDSLLCLMAYDDEHHRVALVQVPSLLPKSSSPPMCGLQHIAFTYSSLAGLLESWEARKKCGIEPVLCVNHGPTTSMYYKDPDGNSVEMQVDNFESSEEATQNIREKAYRENPIGVEFRPEELIERLKKGESEAELKVRNSKLGRDLDESVLGALL